MNDRSNKEKVSVQLSNKSTTPKTDSVAGCDWAGGIALVPYEFAQQLERENTLLTQELQRRLILINKQISLEDQAEALLNLLESDFGQSGRDVRLEAIKLELDFSYQRGIEHATKYKKKVNPHCPQNGILCAPSGDGKCVACDDNNGAID